MKYLFKSVILLFLFALVSSCATYNPELELTGKLSKFKKVLVQGDDFLITTYQKITDSKKPYIFYIEGDGRVALNRHRLSDNPTPRQKMFIELAALDKRPNIVYVARPCQYTPMELNPKCNSDYWSSKRMSNDSVESLNKVINKVNNGQKFSLIGFSGGGAVAVLIAARNNNVRDIITLAGNLDHKSFTKFHRSNPITDSLNPIEYTDSVKSIPQIHISGGKDTRVPAFIAAKFVDKINSPCATHKIYKKASHNSGWDKIWHEVYTLDILNYLNTGDALKKR